MNNKKIIKINKLTKIKKIINKKMIPINLKNKKAINL